MAQAATVTDVDREAIAKVCNSFGVAWLALFGSVARGEATPESDVDLLYELEPGRRMGYIALETMSEEFGLIFGRTRVDLARPSQLHWLIRDKVLAEAQVLYAR